MNNDLCKKSDIKGKIMCDKMHKPYFYYCPAGLMETMTPVLYGEKIIGYIMIGEFLTPEIKANSDNILDNISKNHKFDKNLLKPLFQELPVFSEKEINAYINILQKCIKELWIENIISVNNNEFINSIINYIENSLENDLSARILCKNFYISKNKLYAIFKNEFNVSLKEYVNQKKIEKVNNLLIKTNLSIKEIASKIGFKEYQNFLNFFKSYEKTTPLKFRNKHTVADKKK